MLLEQWTRIKGIVGEALERPPDQRDSYLDSACLQDQQLRAEVDSLLAAYKDASPLSLAWTAAPDETEPALETIGPYRLDRELGVGGMGHVWLAEQTEPVHRWVALKLIKAGMYDAGTVQRFRVERQSLAQMNHPAIAKVFDAGTMMSGQPYFVMEYVEGLPITEYCDQKQLGIRERLRLFLLVCEGVQHAHQKAIIHRDLKPSNILVAEIDGKPLPRIIDFGLAKPTASLDASDRIATQLGALLGTPGYMSPEQADPGFSDVDTRTDVFSLGVILYQLLTGSLPYETSRSRTRGIETVLRDLREVDPQLPSARVRSQDEEALSRAENRNTNVRELAVSLQGDLDWITMKALEKDRERRYASPSELAADIDRFLQVRPVEARPASALYRWRKYVRRHRLGAMVAAASALILIVFVINQSVQLKRIRRERDRADRIAQFTSSIFTVADPSETRGNNITARELLDKAEHNIDAELNQDPALQAQMLKVIATVYQRLGLYSKASDMFRRVIELNEQTLGPKDPETLSASAYLAHCLAQNGHLQESDALDRKLLPIATEALGKDHRTTLQVKYDLAWTLESEGRAKEAEPLAQEALASQIRTLGNGDRDTLDSMRSLAWILTGEGRYSEAEQLDRKALDTSRRVLGPDDPETLLFMEALATVLGEIPRDTEAEQLLRETLTVQKHVLGPDHQNVATTMNSLGIILQHQKKYNEAEAFYSASADILSRTLGPENPSTLLARINIATVREDTGHLKEAEQQYKDVLKIQLRTEGQNHPHVVLTLYNVAEVYRKEKRFADSITSFREAVDVSRKALGPTHPTTFDSIEGLACSYNLNGQRDKAIETLQEMVSAGYADSKSLVEDKDLETLATDPRFQAVVEQSKHNGSASAQQTN